MDYVSPTSVREETVSRDVLKEGSRDILAD